jgi:FG-GAP-like repeat
MTLRSLATLLVLFLTLQGCPETPGDDDDDTTKVDADGDGWDSDTDCDDGDPALNLDDADGDGFSTCDGDCDDDDPAVHPDADEEWFDDFDSNCDGDPNPDACEDPPPESLVDIDDQCTYTPTGNIDPVTEWQISEFDDYPGNRDVVMAPMVGQLTDDNGDGVIDALDTPDICFIARDVSNPSANGVLRIVSGDGSAVHAAVHELEFDNTVYGLPMWTALAIGNIDGDPEPEIVATVSGGGTFVGAFSNNGTLEWVHTDNATGSGANAPALHDLEGDGDVEVVVGPLILNGADGSLQGLGTGGVGGEDTYGARQSFGVDMDGDGVMEILAGSHIYDPQGNTLCTTGEEDGFPSVADLDGDGLGEMVVSGNDFIRLFEHDCTLIDEWPINGGGRGGTATIADFDGDGQLEIAVAGATLYTVHEIDGSVLWQQPITDASSNCTGSSVFDFDGDGAAEVVYADEYTLWVFDGATGAVVFQDEYHSSGTLHEYPVIADVDGDGKAEIVVANDSNYTASYGIQVLGDANDEWVSARSVWNQAAYTITNVNDDLSIPTNAAPNWPTYNNFRQGAPGSFDPLGAPNLTPVVHGPCQANAGDPGDVLVQVANDGVVTAPANLELAVYGEDSGGARTLLDSTVLGDPLLSGALSAPFSFTFDAADLDAYVRLVAVVDDLAAANECDEADNEAELDLAGVES